MRRPLGEFIVVNVGSKDISVHLMGRLEEGQTCGDEADLKMRHL